MRVAVHQPPDTVPRLSPFFRRRVSSQGRFIHQAGRTYAARYAREPPAPGRGAVPPTRAKIISSRRAAYDCPPRHHPCRHDLSAPPRYFRTSTLPERRLCSPCLIPYAPPTTDYALCRRCISAVCASRSAQVRARARLAWSALALAFARRLQAQPACSARCRRERVERAVMPGARATARIWRYVLFASLLLPAIGAPLSPAYRPPASKVIAAAPVTACRLCHAHCCRRHFSLETRAWRRRYIRRHHRSAC